MAQDLDKRDCQSNSISEIIDNLHKLERGALKLTKNWNDAQDLMQDTVVMCVTKIHLFKPGTNVMAWASRVMFNTFVNGYRRKVRKQNGHQRYVHQAKQVSFDKEPGFEEINPKIIIALMRLKPENRNMFIHHHLYDMSYKEVAELHKCPIGTVMSRLSRAKQFLRQELSNGIEIF